MPTKAKTQEPTNREIFDLLNLHINDSGRRFESLEKRQGSFEERQSSFEEAQKSLLQGQKEILEAMHAFSEEVDERFDYVDQHFCGVDERLDALDYRMENMEGETRGVKYRLGKVERKVDDLGDGVRRNFEDIQALASSAF